MIIVNEIYKNKDAAESFILACEQSFNRMINKVCHDLSAKKDIKVIALSGPTCSGKTTTAALLTANIEKFGKRARVLSIDDFYFSCDEMKERNITDFESVAAIDLELLSTTINDLIEGKKAYLPTFDFTERKRVAMTEYIPDKSDIYIFEGIQSLYPEIVSMFSHVGFKSIFINVAKDLKICNTLFEKNEIRLMRRIVRDYFHRAASPELTMELWKNVRENEESNIFPYSSKADFVISSMLPYEVFMLGKYFLNITKDFQPTAVGYAQIKALRNKLVPIADNCIEKDMIPQNSVFREFI